MGLFPPQQKDQAIVIGEHKRLRPYFFNRQWDAKLNTWVDTARDLSSDTAVKVDIWYRTSTAAAFGDDPGAPDLTVDLTATKENQTTETGYAYHVLTTANWATLGGGTAPTASGEIRLRGYIVSSSSETVKMDPPEFIKVVSG